MNVQWRGPKPVIVPEVTTDAFGRPPARWWWAPSVDERYRTLRGRAAFDLARQCGVDVRGPDDVIPEGDWFWQCRHSIRHRFMVGNPGDPRLLKTYRQMRESTSWDLKIVVDVTFPVLDLEALFGGISDENDPLYGLDVDATRSYWREHMPNLLAMVRLADAVTTVQPEWATQLSLTNENVHVLPDLNDSAQAPDFLRTVAHLFGDEDLIT